MREEEEEEPKRKIMQVKKKTEIEIDQYQANVVNKKKWKYTKHEHSQYYLNLKQKKNTIFYYFVTFFFSFENP